MAGKIFVNYRRDDSAAHALNVAQYLELTFGKANVFLDIDRMRPGQKFPIVLEGKLADCKVMLTVIGPGWLNARDEATGGRRLDNTEDWVRLEIERALARGVTVIPVLVAGATLPAKALLPASLQPLVDHQCVTITTNGFRNEMAGLARDLTELMGRRTWLPLTAGTIGAVLLGGYALAYQAGVPVWVPWTPAAIQSDTTAAAKAKAKAEDESRSKAAEDGKRLTALLKQEQEARAKAEAEAKRLADAAAQTKRDQEIRQKAEDEYPVPPRQSVIPIASIGPMTGQFASFGAQFRAGAEMAVADINAAGGVNGKKLDLIIEDDACDPKQAVRGAGRLAAHKVLLVAGHFCSSSSIPASKVYAEEGIFQISPASTHPKLTDERAGPNVFRVIGRDDEQGDAAGKYLARRFKGKNVALIHDRSAYGQGLADETMKSRNAAGVKEALYEAYTPGERDYRALVAKLNAAKIDVVFLGGYHTEGGLILREMRVQGMNAILMGGDALVTKEFWQITGAAGDGTLMTYTPDPRNSKAAADVVKRFRDKKIEPEGYVLYTYAAIQVWAQAATEAKSEDSKAVIAQLNQSTLKTVLGDFRFDAKGDPNLLPFKVFEWKGGSYDQIN